MATTARAVGGIQCTGCRAAESIPPRDGWYIETPVSVKTTTTLTTLQGYVTTAEADGDGWVNLVMHDVCDRCSTPAISPTTLDAFAGWLSGRGTPERTVDEVIGGEPLPIVYGPEGNDTTVRNTSLEDGGGPNRASQCWWFGGFGDNTHAWTKITGSQAHTGDVAYRVDVARYVDGDRRLQPFEDTGGCALSATPGHRYQLGPTTAPTRV